jgi:hypothetical protein
MRTENQEQPYDMKSDTFVYESVVSLSAKLA